MALYSKYRPKTFADMVGQEAARQTLLAISERNKFTHAYLFCGTRGSGKTTSARILAKSINCQNKQINGDPCDTCDLCQMANDGRLTDIIEIDAASNRGIDEVRSLIEKVAFQPNFGKSKIYIIDEVHMMTKEAFNALLKTLEEPPSHAYFILATTEFHKVPETIRSRCQTYFFRNIPIESMVQRMEYICQNENIEYEKKGLELIASKASGGLRDAISLLEQSSSYGIISVENIRASLGIISSQTLEDFMNSITQGATSESLNIITNIQIEGRSLEEFGKDFLWYLRNQLHSAVQEKKINISILLSYIDIFQSALQKSKQLPIPSLAFEIAIAESFLLQFSNEKTNDQAIPPPSKPTPKLVEKIITPVISEEKKSSDTPPWDLDFLPPANTSLQPTSSEIKKENMPEKMGEKPVEKKSEKSGSIENQWNDICKKMPTSIRLNLVEYGSILSFDENHLSLNISSPATKGLLESEKNKIKIESILSEHFGKPITVDFDRNSESKNASEGLTPEGLESMFRM